jgi:CrcB protein
MNYVWIFIGGGLGSIARFAASGLVARMFGETFPWGTIVVNVSGSFLIGVVATLAAPEGRLFLSPEARQFILLGLFGGYTTFSSFSIQTLTLARDGEWLQAGANVLLSVALCLVAVWLGYMLAANINSAKGS